MSSCNCTGQCRKVGSCSSGVSYTPQIKELSDEEIYEIWWQSDIASNYYRDSKEFGIEFAKAILRKAQEK